MSIFRQKSAVMGIAILSLAACSPSGAGTDAEEAAASGTPAETRAPETNFKPAFAGQTRAPAPAAIAYQTELVADGLEKPWALAFMPDGRMLVTEKDGFFRFVTTDGALGPRTKASPEVHAKNQGGLLDVHLDPDFADNRIVWWTYAEPRGEKNGTAVAKAVLDASGDAPVFSDIKVIFRQQPGWKSDLHFGSRLAFSPDGKLFVALGERSVPDARVLAQDLGTHFGKVVRLETDGRPAEGNPFIGRKGALPEIWSYGHRNQQSAAIDPATGKLWTIEHGPRGGDELNQPEAGRNYGWPVISYGIEYAGAQIGEGRTQKDGMEQPVYYWDPVIAPSGMVFYTGAAFPEWQGSIFVGGLASKKLVRLEMKDGEVASEEWLATDLGKRIRDVRQGPDGYIYMATDEGQIYRIRP